MPGDRIRAPRAGPTAAEALRAGDGSAPGEQVCRAGRARPALNTLGGSRWLKARAQAARAVHDLAAELLAVQAARASLTGHACPVDTPWQREFEGAFLFVETPDQLGAIQDTKKDLETPRPMDRLICGDVGFGKTEVALRAAFKVVMSGKQTAILVPTTVLAQQHYNTFCERMAHYPVRVELLSRYRSRRAQARIVRDLAAGSVDIVIGTHRLLQADIAFKDLGLVVIDEEQRFGVLHKEKFKRLRRLVDVLTLSATPDPADAVSGADGRAGHEHPRDTAAGPAAGGNTRRGLRRTGDPRRHPPRTQPPGPGVLPAQPDRHH